MAVVLVVVSFLAVPAARAMPSSETHSAWQEGAVPNTLTPPIQSEVANPHTTAEMSELLRGQLTIRAVQGTPGEPEISGGGIEVDLVHRGEVIKTVTAELNEAGIAQFSDLPIGLEVQPVIRISHAGVTYQEVGSMMGALNQEQTVEVVCFEVTRDVPAWTIRVRQIMLVCSPEGVRVTEIIVIENPGQRTWLGTPQPTGDPLTTAITIPPNATDIQLGAGFHGWCCTDRAAGVLVNHLPLMPHETEMDFSYTVPTSDGVIELSLIAPTEIGQMVVIVPESLITEHVHGLAFRGNRKISDTPVRHYSAGGLARGETVSLTLTSLTPSAQVPTEPRSDPQAASLDSKRMIMLVVGALLVAGVVVVLVRNIRRNQTL